MPVQDDIEPDPLEPEVMAEEELSSPAPQPWSRRPLWQRILLWFVPNLTAFIASFCIMVLELVAGRLIARYLGSSLYTWTSVIGIVLAGITIGNLIGGRLADWFRPASVLSVLFVLASLACVAIPIANDKVHEMPGWTLKKKEASWMTRMFFLLSGDEKLKEVDDKLAQNPPDDERKTLLEERSRIDGDKRLPWSLRIFFHVFLVFLVPSTLLGMIGPVVAKMALDQGRQIGRTVGNVYAWGALGSIVGTFVTGFYLIANYGTNPVIYGVGIVLGLVGILYLLGRFWVLSGAASMAFFLLSILPALSVVAFLSIKCSWPWEWVERDGRTVLREKLVKGEDDEEYTEDLYVEESQYTYMKIDRKMKKENGELKEVERDLVMDSLIHAEWVPGDATDLKYDYEKIYRAFTHRAAPADAGEAGKMACLFIGGGGYVYPRYIRDQWPGAYIEVAEIDPAVTAADVAGFGLEEDRIQVVESADDLERDDNPIWIHHLDARNHVDDLIRRKDAGEKVPEFDFVFGDAFNFLGVPFHLTTLEFNEKVKRLMRPGSGVYMINIIDIYYSGKFLAAVYNTFVKTFGEDNVYVLCTNSSVEDVIKPGARDTFIVIGSLRPLDLAGLPGKESPYDFEGMLLGEDLLKVLTDDKHLLILTDNYAPVENLLEYVVNRWKS